MRVRAHHADPPDVGRVRAEPAADLDVVLGEQPHLHLLAVDALGHADGGELCQLPMGICEQLKSTVAQRRLQVGARLGVTAPPGLQALLERQPQPLVEGVVLHVRRRVVVLRRARDPVRLELLEVEAERHRRGSAADALHRLW